jgi:hypothetical protein
MEANRLAPYSGDIVARPRLHAGHRKEEAPVFLNHPNCSFPKSPTPIVLGRMIYLFHMHFVGQ